MRTTLAMILALLSVGASAQGRFGRSAVGSTVRQLAEVTGTQPGAGFGSVAVSGSTVVIGSSTATVGCNGQANCGAAYVFTQTSGDWGDLALVATLTESNGAPLGAFGQHVAISGDVIVVGGYDATIQQDAAYVFVEPADGWQDMTETAELSVSGGQPFEQISGVAIDGDVLVVGTPFTSVGRNVYQGTAYVYVKPAGGWTSMSQSAQLFDTDGKSNFEFGWSVGVSGRNIVVGAPGAPAAGLAGVGLAYIFVEPRAGWSGIVKQTSELQPSNGNRTAAFGVSVSVSGDTAAVGAPYEIVNSGQSEGAAYVFARPSTGWPKTMTETAELTAATGGAGEALGTSVAISNRTLIAGAPRARNDQGIVYLFLESSGGWQSTSSANEISATDAASNNELGELLVIGDGVFVVSAPDWPTGGLTPDGAVYVFGAQ